jgi:hypothetical protein
MFPLPVYLSLSVSKQRFLNVYDVAPQFFAP